MAAAVEPVSDKGGVEGSLGTENGDATGLADSGLGKRAQIFASQFTDHRDSNLPQRYSNLQRVAQSLHTRKNRGCEGLRRG